MFHRADFEREFESTRRLAVWKIFIVGFPMGLTAGLLGIGGGAVCVPTQQVLLRIPLRRAIANSSATILCVASLGATYKNLTLPEHGIAVTTSLWLALTLVPTAILGGYCGGKLTHVIPRKLLRIVFIFFMASVAYMTFVKAWSAVTQMREDKASVSNKGTPCVQGARCHAPREAWARCPTNWQGHDTQGSASGIAMASGRRNGRMDCNGSEYLTRRIPWL